MILARLIEEYLHETGNFDAFSEWLSTKGYTSAELGFSSDEEG